MTSHALRRMCRAGTVADRCVFGWGVCVRVSGASRFRPREGTSHTTPPTTSGATNEMHRTIRIKTAPFVSFTRRIRPFHPPPRRSTRVSKGTTRARDDGGRWPAAGEFYFGVSSSQVVIAMAKIANAERRVGLRPAAGGDLILSAVAGRENLCSLAHMEVACGARCAAWCALVVLWRWSHLASCAATRLFSQVFKTRRAM